MKRLLLMTMCFLLCGCSLLVEKVDGRISWDADQLLIWDYGSDRALLVEDAKTLQALWDSYTWCNFHLECCVADPDFWGYVFHENEQISRLYGHLDDRTDSYNPAFVRKLTALGKAEPNVYVTRVTIPAGMQPEEAAALAGGHALPLFPEDYQPRMATLTASCTTVFENRDDLTPEWHDTAALGEFPGDEVFLPLLFALVEERVFDHAGAVYFRSASYMQPPEKSSCTRAVTFYLKDKPDFDRWEGVALDYSPAKAWDALIVTEEPLDEEHILALAEAGVMLESEQP